MYSQALFLLWPLQFPYKNHLFPSQTLNTNPFYKLEITRGIDFINCPASLFLCRIYKVAIFISEAKWEDSRQKNYSPCLRLSDIMWSTRQCFNKFQIFISVLGWGHQSTLTGCKYFIAKPREKLRHVHCSVLILRDLDRSGPKCMRASSAWESGVLWRQQLST